MSPYPGRIGNLDLDDDTRAALGIVATAVIPAPQLTDSQQMALVMMLWSEKELRAQVVERLKAERKAAGLFETPSQQDFIALRDMGLAYRAQVHTYSRLTRSGETAAIAAALGYARRLAIHVPRYSTFGYIETCRCSCGTFSRSARVFGTVNLLTTGRSFSLHMDDVKAGTWNAESPAMAKAIEELKAATK